MDAPRRTPRETLNSLQHHATLVNNQFTELACLVVSVTGLTSEQSACFDCFMFHVLQPIAAMGVYTNTQTDKNEVYTLPSVVSPSK